MNLVSIIYLPYKYINIDYFTSLIQTKMENDPLLCFINLFELFKIIKKWYYTLKKG